MESVIQVQDLVKDYLTGFWLNQRVRVLDGVSFEVGTNQVFGLLGPNGAGKTTTLKTLMGLVRPTSGQALVFGRPARDAGTRQRVGFLPENPYYYMYLSGDEFLRFCADLFSMKRADARRRAKELLELVGLKDEGGKPLRTYSKGMLQRVGIAQALINDPEVVFLDEPTTGLDPIGRMEVRQIMHQLKKDGKTILFNTHILPDVEEICDYAAIMHKGKIRKSGNIEQMTSGDGRYLLQAREVPAEQQGKLESLGANRVLSATDGGWEAVFADEAQALQAAERIKEWGGHVTNLGVYRRPLEDVFMETIRAADGEGAR